MVSLSCRSRKVMNQCFDLCGLSCSSEIKTSLTISDTCTLSSPSCSSSRTLQAALHDAKEHRFCGCHKPASHLPVLAAALRQAGLLQLCLARRGPGQDSTVQGEMLSCPVPSRSLRSNPGSLQASDLQVLRVPAAGRCGDMGNSCPSPQERGR